MRVAGAVQPKLRGTVSTEMHVASVVREMLLYHCQLFADPAEQIEQARKYLDYVARGMLPSSGVTTRFGPSAPRWSQIDADPGPPLNAKQTGRVAEAAPLST